MFQVAQFQSIDFGRGPRGAHFRGRRAKATRGVRSNTLRRAHHRRIFIYRFGKGFWDMFQKFVKLCRLLFSFNFCVQNLA